MVLYTIQSEEVVNKLMNEGSVHCEVNKSEYYNEDEHFNKGYRWMSKKLTEKVGYKKGIYLPLWAWFKYNGKEGYDPYEFDNKSGKKYFVIKFEIPDNEVLLSDYNSWNNILCGNHFNNAKTEEEWIKLEEYYLKIVEQYGFEKYEKEKEKSWEGIFDVEPIETDFYSQGQYVQAVFWEIRKDMVLEINEFIPKTFEED